MRKRISSFIAAMFLLMVCVFASSCGNKYEDLEFKIYYAFSSDAVTWFDGTNGISLNYNPDEVYTEGERSSFVFDANGEAPVYFKIEIENVKAKHLDKITVSARSSIMPQKHVAEGEVFSMVVKKDANGNANLNTSFKMYENNSAKSFETPFVISRKLEGLAFDNSIKPAVYTGKSLNLLDLDEYLIYTPNRTQTNQLGVTYSIASIGAYDKNTRNYIEKYSAKDIADANYISQDDLDYGILTINNGAFLGVDAYVVRVKATSIYYDGSNELLPEISTEFDVYVAEGTIANPVLKFENNSGNPINKQINIYDNAIIYAADGVAVEKDYSVATFYVDKKLTSFYNSELSAHDGTSLKYEIALYVLNSQGKYQKYDFTEPINGLSIKDNKDGSYTVSNFIVKDDDNTKENVIKVFHKITGLDFSAGEEIDINNKSVGTSVKVVKSVAPTYLIVNNSKDLKNGSTEQATIYGTTSETYKGLELKLSATPNDNLNRKIVFEPEAGLIVKNAKGQVVNEMVSGSSVFVTFDANIVEKKSLKIKTLIAPTYYNEQTIVASADDKNYLTVTYEIDKLVTADSFEFVEEDGAIINGVKKINAETDNLIYVRAYYTGVNLETKTINLKSDNDKVVFANGLKEICLSDVAFKGSGTDAVNGCKYNLYEIQIKSTQALTNANIKIVAGEGSVGVEKDIKVNSVFIADENEVKALTISAKTENVKTFTTAEVDNYAFNFAIAKGEFAQFQVYYGVNETKAFTDLKVQTNTDRHDAVDTNFDINALDYRSISNSLFVATGKLAGKTQILKVVVTYHKLESDKIVEATEEKEVQIAVFEQIGNIGIESISNNEIGYINKYFEDITSTEIEFNSYTATVGTPAGGVIFATLNNKNEYVYGASRTRIYIENFNAIKNAGYVSIKFDGVELEQQVNTINGISGKITISILGENTHKLDEIKLVIKALRFDEEYSVLSNVVIKIVDVKKAEKILVSSDDFVAEKGTQEIQMSFIGVQDGQCDMAQLNAELKFKEDATENKMRFDKINNALTHVVYRYDLDSNGDFIYVVDGNGNRTLSKTLIDSNFFIVDYNENGTVTIEAFKNLGGGVFKFVLATKDSYNSNLDPKNNDVYEEYFDNKFSFTIRVSDGELGSEYLIKTEDDLKLINYNLSKNFVLAANVGFDEEVNIEPIGLIGTSVNTFKGTFSGVHTVVVENGTVSTAYSIILKIEQSVLSTEYGSLFGLFAIVDENATISDLQLNVSYSSSFVSNYTKGLKVGALAGVNKGTIENVDVCAEKAVDIRFTSAGTIDFGGIVGVNTNEIKSSKVDCLNNLLIVSDQKQTHNIGLVSGTNEGTITGTYQGKESLNDFVYDVYARLSLINSVNSSDAQYYVGSVAGYNTGVVENVLVGGKLTFDHLNNTTESGYVGGIVGYSKGNGNAITTSTAMALDIEVTNSADLNIGFGGIVGLAEGAEIYNVKFVSVQIRRNEQVTTGKILGKQNVGGVVANSVGGKISYSSVESFIFEVIDESKEPGTPGYSTPYYTLNGNVVGGIVSTNSGTTVENSFVHANLKGTNVNLTTTATQTNTYYIGEVDGSVVNNSTYSVVNGKVYKSGVEQASFVYSESAAYGLVGLNATNNVWMVKENYNVVKLATDIYLPYLLFDHDGIGSTPKQPLMIVEPKSISANINTTYIVNVDAVFVSQFNFEEYESKVEETVIVNFFDEGSDADNSHRLISTKDSNGIKLNNGLLDATIIPEDAQGGLAFEILGSGYKYAYLTYRSGYNEIVFTAPSGNIPIVVRIYSIFNTELNVYVVFYSQSLLTELEISSNAVFKDVGGYSMNLYTGQANKTLSLSADNNDSSTLFDNYEIAEYIQLTTNHNELTSKIDLQVASYQSIALKIDLEEGESVVSGEEETITFTIYLKPEYFGNGLVVNPIRIGDVTLKVYLYNSASSMDIDGTDAEISTNDDYQFDVRLTTDYTSADCGIEDVEIDDTNGDIYFLATDRDSIRIKLDVVEGDESLLIANVNSTIENQNDHIKYFSELFNISITSSLMLSKPDNKVIGYIYNVKLELINNHHYRYITENIKFNIYVLATSNPDVNNDKNPIEIVLKPTNLSTARIESYVVKKLNVYTDYSNIVSNEDVETSIIEPGKLGNVMLIYLEPTYAQVKSAKIRTKDLLFVPSLNKNVKLHFTQLVHDKRRYSEGVFTTLYGENNVQDENGVLDLQLISRIDENGKRIYDGVICLYVQLEEFAGLEDTITAELIVESVNGEITRTRELLTSYLPGTEMRYDNNKAIDDGYLIQKGTSNNEIDLKVYGYQYNSDPSISFAWDLPTEKEANGNPKVDADGNVVVDKSKTNFDYKIVDGKQNRSIITNGSQEYLIGDYISYTLMNSYLDVVYNEFEKSYTMKVKLNIASNIPAPFVASAKLRLVTKDGQLNEKEDSIKFYPTDYILNSVSVEGLVNGRRNIAINESKAINLTFATDSTTTDYSSQIFAKLLTYADADATLTLAEKIGTMFTYYRNGEIINFNDKDKSQEFVYNLINENTISITGLFAYQNTIQFEVYYGYKLTNGIYELAFGQSGDLVNATPISFMFTLNIYIVNEENVILVRTADDIYNSVTAQWNLVEGAHYVLLNDITLDNVVPISTAIASFDGNDRVISIQSFKVDNKKSDYGLFETIGTYEVKDQGTEKTIIKQTILKNMIVDYSKFNGTVALNNVENKNVVFGGLVARNNGGLIYNCDVMNLYPATNKTVDLIVSSASNVTFGGLVGENKGVITNSRVGRDSYTRIVATATTESKQNILAGGLSFGIYNRATDNDDMNQFSVVAGGFVGSNSGTISSSYVTKTNLFNYSTHESNNKTAGFVGENSGTIQYSFTKSDDKTITSLNPYSTGYIIENKGNGIVSGFVYSNSGKINNSYANYELQTKSAYISGFVYTNSGAISESYAATKMTSGIDSSAEQPFVGVDNAGVLLSNGTLENTYYLMRSEVDTPFKQDNKDVAQGLNRENFQKNEYLVGFAFVLSNAKVEREQGVWSYYTLDSQKRILPELITANVVAHSHRFVIDESASEQKLTNAMSYQIGSSNNPYTISSVEEYNKVFTTNGLERNLSGYVRFINNINFNDDKTAILTRSNFMLGASQISTRTSVEGNGLTISGIYLDVGEAIVEKVGLFAEIQNTFIKNLNLEFATPVTDGQFSTTTATYSGGLAGKITNSVILNINLKGNNTTLAGNNFVGGVAGLISGNSLVYGIETNLNVKVGNAEKNLYYSEKDYRALNIQNVVGYNYNEYLKHLSYAGGVAGVLDLTERAYAEYNVQFIDVRGDLMNSKTYNGTKEANILAEYAGGVAGYASKDTSSFKLRYFVGDDELIRGDTAVGGLYGVCLGRIIASQVTAEEEIQFEYDTTLGEYIIGLETDANSTLNKDALGNLNLLEGYKYVGGLVGVGIGADLKATYSKVGIKSGEIVGGLMGVSVASITTYSYSIPYINIYAGMKKVGGLFGSAYGVQNNQISRNVEVATYEKLVKYNGVISRNTDIQFTYSTLILDNSKLSDKLDTMTFDYVCADYSDADRTYLQSNANVNLVYVYAGKVNYSKVGGQEVVNNNTKITSQSAIVELYKLFNVEDATQVVAYQEVFSGWALIKFWSLDEDKYFPLLNNESVDNFINIDDAADFEQIASNPEGKYRVVNDITIPIKTSNWIVSGSGKNAFSGVIIGEIEGDSKRPVITIEGIHATATGNSSGFFQETLNATISNLVFEWNCGDSMSDAAIKMNSATNLTMVSGLSCDDKNSLISNVEVRVTDAGYIFSDDDRTISGFGGIVGKSENTNILGCKFAGKINAKLNSSDNIYVGGIAGSIKTVKGQVDEFGEEVTSTSGVINNSLVGVAEEKASEEDINKKYPKTEFTLQIAKENTAPIYIGGAVGRADNIALASTNVGGIKYTENYKEILFDLTFNELQKNAYIGGLIGYAENGSTTKSQAISKIEINGEFKTDATSELNVGGLMGSYSQGLQALNSGIETCEVKSNIDAKTFTATTGTVKLSTGVAQLNEGSTMKSCLLTGAINTENATIATLYAGGVAGYVAGSTANHVRIAEVVTNTELYVGNASTENLYAGGLIGVSKNVQISYSASWGRIVPITNQDVKVVRVGGLIGEIQEVAKVNNSYTVSSVVADSIAGKALEKLEIGALVGVVPNNAKVTDVNFSQVYYSSDYALFADENRVENVEIGTNLSAQVMLNDSSWKDLLRTEGENVNDIWVNFNYNGNSRLPYPTSLEISLKSFEILARRVVGEIAVDYLEGTAMRPVQVLSGTEVTFRNNYTYYLLIQNGSDKSTPKFTGTLKGILFGQDLEFKDTFTVGTLSTGNADSTDYDAIIPVVEKHSAVSNLNVMLTTPLALKNPTGIIAGYNEGVIFNCSVQGNGIELSGNKEFGLISSKNNGLIAYSYSTVEIIASEGTVGGIVNTNGGKLLSNYFTGYIATNDKNIYSAGIVVEILEGDTYAYNNYMAGVIKFIYNNSFVNNGTLIGAKNFMDMYSDYNYYTNNKNDEILKPVSTASLMAGAELSGKWHTAGTGTALNTNSEVFGYNYNYPIYQFNKKMLYGNTLIVNDWKNQLPTGTGVVDETEDTNLVDEFTLTERYEVILNTPNSTNYANAFKIPHLGVLASVQALLDDEISRNFVVIYDLNGNYATDKYISWNAIGATVAEHGFAVRSKINEETGETKTLNQFNGLFITNKYFNQNIPTAENSYLCEITNLTNNGLFENVGEAYLGNIALGNFLSLNASGALASNVVKVENKKTIINKVNFVENAVVSGVENEDKYFGGLFGKVSGDLEINLFASAIIDNGSSEIKPVKLKSKISDKDEGSTTGLIAGELAGATITLNTHADSLYAVRFDGVKYGGGLVGKISGNGTITGNNNVIHIANSKYTDGAGNEITVDHSLMLGGIVALVDSTGGTIGGNVSSLEVKLYSVKEDLMELLTNGFGGIAGEVNAELTVSTIKMLTNNNKLVGLVGNRNKNLYYGLIAGLQTAEITTTDEVIINENLQNIEVVSTPALNENQNTVGVGLLVGNSTATFNLQVEHHVKNLSVANIANVGGVVGYASGVDSHTLNITLNESCSSPFVNGYYNVGGLIGWLDSSITKTSGTLFEIKRTTASVTPMNGSNFGGLFGKWTNATNSWTSEDGKIEYKALQNSNAVSGASYSPLSAPQVSNIGGIAGKIEAVGNVGELKNISAITLPEIVDAGRKISSATADGFYHQRINVGGVFGLFEGNVQITNIFNSQAVQGYQNVGGLIGYAKGNISISNPKSITLKTTGEEPDIVIHDLKLEDNGTLDAGYVIAQETSGEIHGVINVGGVIGYAGEGVNISLIYNKANVYGNASVGGIAGFAKSATINNTYTLGEKDADGKHTAGIVKGIYYNQTIDEETNYDFIPTSVGGLVGSANSSTLTNNILENAFISSTEEGGKTGDAVISTISNHMVDIDLTGTEYNSIVRLTATNKVDFNDINTGYGGFVGTLDSATMASLKTPSYIKNIKLNAQLSVNVGTFFGSYQFNSAIDNNGTSIALLYPQIFGNGTTIDGAYNIGGILGFIACTDATFGGAMNLTNNVISGAGTVTLQNEIKGFYVGGLIGKTASNEISGLSVATDTAKIQINTANCYYAGGLIGKAEVTGNANISGSVGTWTNNVVDDTTDNIVAEGSDDRINFGGLIGLLSVGESAGGLTVTVSGQHNFPFTINTIENVNYFDGQSRFNSKEDENGIALFAEAKYVNLDKFQIVGSSNKLLYEIDTTKGINKNSADKEITNPLNLNAKGWAKEYTGFKQLQRRIPKEDNNGATWDSISVLFDASQITHVGTIGNLGLSGKTFKTKSGNQQLSANHVCFTVYEHEHGDAMLYSAIGIAKVYLSYEEEFIEDENGSYAYDTVDKSYVTFNAANADRYKKDNNGDAIRYKENPRVYAKPKDGTASALGWVGAVLMEESPYQEFYIDANNDTNGLQALTYFSWGDTGGWKEYETLGDKKGKKSDTTYQYTNTDGENTTKGNVKRLSYFVPGYNGADGTTGAQYGTEFGAYFIFTTVFTNSSIINCSAEGVSIDKKFYENVDAYLPSSGLMFEVSGFYDETTDKLRYNSNDTDDFKTAVIVGSIAVDVIITLATFGVGGGLIAARKGAQQAAKGLAKDLAKKAAKQRFKQDFKKHIARSVGKGVRGFVKTGAKLVFRMAITGLAAAGSILIYNTAKAQEHYFSPSPLSYGYLASTYSRDVSYVKDDKTGEVYLAGASDYMYDSDNGDTYFYYSADRPSDYHINRYVAKKIYTLNGTSDAKKVIVMDDFNLDGTYEDSIKECGVNDPDIEIMGIYKIKYDDNENDDDYEDQVLVGKDRQGEQRHYYILTEKYELKHGQYYINGFCSEIELMPTSIGTKPNMDEPRLIQKDGKYYIYGKFENGIYNYLQHNDNVLTSNGDGTYNFNGKTLNQSEIEAKPTEAFKYVADTEKPAGQLGYDYFEKVYYTIYGKKIDGVDARYAKFVAPAGFTKSSGSEYSWKYEKVDLNTIRIVESWKEADGFNTSYQKITEDPGAIDLYQEISPGNYTVYAGTYEDACAEGVEVFKEIKTQKYKNKTQRTNFALTEISKSQQQSADDLAYVYVEVNPATFKNPYNKVIANSYNDANESESEDVWWIFSSDATENYISFTPEKYYLYEGGYTTFGTDGADKSEFPLVYVEMDKTEYMVDKNKNGIIDVGETEYYTLQLKPITNWIDFSSGEGTVDMELGTEQTVSFKDIINSWDDKYKKYFNVDANQAMIELYNVKNGKIYKVNESYSIDNKTGTVAKIKRKLPTGEGSIYENMYLSNSKFGFYTRYKYANVTGYNANSQVDFTNTIWSDYHIIPKVEGSTVINGNRATSFVESASVILGGSESISVIVGKDYGLLTHPTGYVKIT